MGDIDSTLWHPLPLCVRSLEVHKEFSPCLVPTLGPARHCAQNEVESIRLRASDSDTGHQHEMIVAQTPQYTLIVLQGADDGKDIQEEEEKE